MISVIYERGKLETSQVDGKIIRTKVYNDFLVELVETPNLIKEEKKIPHVIAETKGYQLWKFFCGMKGTKMVLLKEPRLLLRKGNEWFKIKLMELL